MPNPHAGRPIGPEVTDADIAAALEDLSVPALLMACVHLCEDDAQRRALLDGPVRPQGLFLNEYQGFMTPEDQAAGRALALDVIRGWRDRGCPEPEPLPPALLHEMMTWLACDTVGDEYVPMVLEELALDGADSRAPEPMAGAAAYPVVIIGCGMSGLLAAIRLQQAGFPFVVVEKNAGPGGTWWENRYPGARVDVGSHFYSYSFEPADHWTEFFSRQPELRAYFERVAEERGVREHVRFGVEATAATYDDESATWTVTLDDGDALTARAVVCAVGQLNRPFVPDVPGEFDG
ncbi:NAD(P)/FAD-dependent oxidoreductase, partial [Nocardioides sp.]|uniref:flavin-containing monooxygenase n=1 Tax=Nocardioides sp. TaxID=35761 RepID=UPI001A24E75A